MKQLSIIVPVYNVENYIRTCIQSIYRQGLDENIFEVIVVNDGTEDNSMAMIEDIIREHNNIIVIEQDNLSLSVARNNGIAKATGEYILMLDSDDLLIDNSLPILLKNALKTKVDLVVADFLEMTDEEIVNFKGITQKEIEFEEKMGEKLLLEDLNPYQCYIWRTLFKRSFIINNHLAFIPDIRYQDVPFTHECYIKAKKCLRTHWLLNIYRKWAGASTLSFNYKKAKDYCIVISKTWELSQISNLSPEVKQKIESNVYTTFSLFYYSVLHTIKDHSSRLEIIDYLHQVAPDLKFSNGTKQKIESIFLSKMPHLYLRIREFRWIYRKRTDI